MSLLGDVRATLRPPPGDRHGPLVPMMVVLTVLTGVVDAVSYLKLGHVFVANMTGNVVFLGFALAGAGGLSAVASILALAAFLLGALAGGWLGAHHLHRGRLLRAANAIQATLLLVALLLSITADKPLDEGVRYAIIILLALAMGVQNAAAQRLAVPELTTTVLTQNARRHRLRRQLPRRPGREIRPPLGLGRRDAARRAARRRARAARLDRRADRRRVRPLAPRRPRRARRVALGCGVDAADLSTLRPYQLTVSVPSMPA